MYPIKRTVYATEEGTVTHDSGEGKNRVVLVLGNEVTQEEADGLKLPELDKATDAKEADALKVLNPLEGLKPAVVEEAPSTPEAPKPSKKPVETKAEGDVK